MPKVKEESAPEPDRTPSTEADLAAGLSRGDAAAVDELYRTYFDRVYTLVYYQVDRDQAAAEDIVQETFLAALRSAKQFKGRSKVYTWLCSIAYHKVADYYRRQSREHRHRNSAIDVDTIDPDGNPGTHGVSPSPTEAAENRSFIQSAMSTLPPDYRQVLLLKYVDELSVVEISRIMRRSQKSIEGLLSRARKAMQDNIAQIDKG